MLMHTANNIRLRRRELGLSLDELGRHTNIERSRLSRAERGYVALGQDELKRLALHLEVDESQLIPPDESTSGGAS